MAMLLVVEAKPSSGEEDGEVLLEEVEWGEREKMDAGLPVTQSDDPLSGGHFAEGTSKPPLQQCY